MRYHITLNDLLLVNQKLKKILVLKKRNLKMKTNCFYCIEASFVSIVCCPCISCFLGFSYCFNDSLCLLEICKKVFENDLITDSVIGKKWSLDNNWLKISKVKKEVLANKLFNIIKNQISGSKINIENITRDYYGKEFLVTQLRWFLKMSIIYYYDKIENMSWNPNYDNFEILIKITIYDNKLNV